MRRVIQKAIIKVVRPRIVEYLCDECGAKLDRSNPKQTIYSNGQKHVCKRKPECNPFR